MARDLVLEVEVAAGRPYYVLVTRYQYGGNVPDAAPYTLAVRR